MPPNMPGRVDWVDYAKGFCIILVVMMHSTLGVEAVLGQRGWMHVFVEFAKPFRMPDFFLISGLFLARVIERDWREYLDKKLVHFVYFYILWLSIQCLLKYVPGAESPVDIMQHFLTALVQPFGTMWFIYLLPVFFVFTKLVRRVPAGYIVVFAAVLEMAPVETGWVVIDEFAGRLIYFFLGYLLARHIFALAELVQRHVAFSLAGLLVWALVNGAMVFMGISELPGAGLGLGLAGAAAVVAISALLAKVSLMSPLRHAGRNSIVIYLAFFLPMALTRTVMVKTGIITDAGTIALVVTAMGVLCPLVLHWLLRRWGVGMFLFERPGWARLGGSGPHARLAGA